MGKRKVGDFNNIEAKLRRTVFFCDDPADGIWVFPPVLFYAELTS